MIWCRQMHLKKIIVLKDGFHPSQIWLSLNIQFCSTFFQKFNKLQLPLEQIHLISIVEIFEVALNIVLEIIQKFYGLKIDAEIMALGSSCKNSHRNQSVKKQFVKISLEQKVNYQQRNNQEYSLIIISFSILSLKIFMGSSFVKDQNVDVYMEVSKQCYFPGQYVQGIIYVNAKNNVNYKNLVVRLIGKEYVKWHQRQGKSTRQYENSYQSYDSIFQVSDFNGTIQQGHYSFPFAFLLPNQMSGSYFFDDACYIRYSLKVILNHPGDEKKSQFFDVNLNIIEPPRMQLGAVQISTTMNLRCCDCCTDYGVTDITLNCDKNFVVNGDTLNISGSIDHSKGKQQIENGVITFEERRVVIEQYGQCRIRIDRSTVLGKIGKVDQGKIENFNIQCQVPSDLNNYTAIGSITGRYFVIAVNTEIGCVTQTPSAALHIVVHSNNPSIMKNNKVPPPANWNPFENPKVVCNHMNPFVYSPLPQLPYTNTSNSANIFQKKNNLGVEPYFQDNVPSESNDKLHFIA